MSAVLVFSQISAYTKDEGHELAAGIQLDITKKYKKGFQLGPLKLVLRNGTTAIVGANGAGKSTLFRIIAGIDQATAGTGITGVDNAKVGYLPQEMEFPRTATCREFLHHVAWLHRVPRDRRRVVVEQALDAVGLKSKADAAIGSLSGGMRRRLGFAHAILHDPNILILDEPTAGLDPVQRKQLRSLIRAQSERRVTLISTHLTDDVADLADRIVILREGQVVFSGDQGELLATQHSGATEQDTDGEPTIENAIINHLESDLEERV